MNKLSQFAVLSFLLLSVLNSHGESHQKKIQNYPLAELKITSLQLSTSFSAFLYFQGDKRNVRRLQSALQKGNDVLDTLGDTNNELQAKWQQSISYINEHKHHRFDGSDISLEVGWSLLQKELNAELNQMDSTMEEISDNKERSDMLQLQLHMERALALYMSFANATTGGFGINQGELTLEQQVEYISTEIAKLKGQGESLDKLRSKWNYINNTLLAYNSNIAPFVVLHTFDKMRTEINAYLVGLPSRQRLASE